MSSTSSSECMCAECFNYGPQFGSPGIRLRAPYQALGHPLIYYAQVKQNPYARVRGSRESKQENPNCFVKAFRWYTQERCCLSPQPPQSRELPSDRTDLKGFSVWLDKKYDEFMLDKRDEQHAFQTQPQRTFAEPNKSSNCGICDMGTKKKIARVRSPWKKRQRTSKDDGEIIDKCSQSFEIIMKPKELSRPASDCCQQASRNRSNISFEKQASKRTVVKSHSSIRCSCERPDLLMKAINPEGNTSKLDRHKSEIQPRGSAPVPRTKELKDAECQSAEHKIKTVDAAVQCLCPSVARAALERPPSDGEKNTNAPKDSRKVASFSEESPQQQTSCTSCRKSREVADFSQRPSQACGDENGSKPKMSRESKTCCIVARSETNPPCPSSEARQKDAQNQSLNQDMTDAGCDCCICDDCEVVSRVSTCNQDCPRMFVPAYQCFKYTKTLDMQKTSVVMTKDVGTEVSKTASKTVSVTFASEEVQTSNHSICLDKNTYPFFMKIVRADKLNEGYIRK